MTPMKVIQNDCKFLKMVSASWYVWVKWWSGPEVIKHFSCPTQLSMNFVLQINLKLLRIAISFSKNIAEHENFSANKYENANMLLVLTEITLWVSFQWIPQQLSSAWQKFYNLGPRWEFEWNPVCLKMLVSITLTWWTVATVCYLLNAWRKVNYASHLKYSMYICILHGRHIFINPIFKKI